jgi:hypothetical protein
MSQNNSINFKIINIIFYLTKIPEGLFTKLSGMCHIFRVDLRFLNKNHLPLKSIFLFKTISKFLFKFCSWSFLNGGLILSSAAWFQTSTVVQGLRIVSLLITSQLLTVLTSWTLLSTWHVSPNSLSCSSPSS